MTERRPLAVTGFKAGVSIIPRRVLRTAADENPGYTEEIEALMEESMVGNMRQGMFTYTQKTGLNLPNSLQIFR